MNPNLMGVSLPQLRRWGARQLLDHRQLNEHIDATDDLTRGVAAPRQVVAVPRGAGKAGGSLVGQFKLKQSAADFPDHLVCRTWDGETEGDADVLIAKPWLLRQTPFDGQIYDGVSLVYSRATKRTATVGAETESQIIIPPFVIGDIIYAVKGIIGGTSVDIEGEPLIWLNENPSRAWTAEEE